MLSVVSSSSQSTDLLEVSQILDNAKTFYIKLILKKHPAIVILFEFEGEKYFGEGKKKHLIRYS